MKPVAVVLSGAGYLDGSEIQESVLTLLALDKRGVKYHCFAPSGTFQVVNHLSQKPISEKREIIVEAARIARSKIALLREANAADLSAAIYPGGYGAVLRLSDFAKEGSGCHLHAEVADFGSAMIQAKKPQGFICIAPTMISKLYGPGVVQTIGKSKEIAEKITQMGGIHQNCSATEIVVDESHQVISTPAYMEAHAIHEAALGIDRLVEKLLEWL